jgi:hypothetical protein
MSNDFFSLKNGLHQMPPSSFSLHQAVVAKLFESLGLTGAQVVYLHLVGSAVRRSSCCRNSLCILAHSAPTGALSPYSTLAGCQQDHGGDNLL